MPETSKRGVQTQRAVRRLRKEGLQEEGPRPGGEAENPPEEGKASQQGASKTAWLPCTCGIGSLFVPTSAKHLLYNHRGISNTGYWFKLVETPPNCQSTETIIVREQSVHVAKSDDAEARGTGASEWAVRGGCSASPPFLCHLKSRAAGQSHRVEKRKCQCVSIGESSRGSYRRRDFFSIWQREGSWELSLM